MHVNSWCRSPASTTAAAASKPSLIAFTSSMQPTRLLLVCLIVVASCLDRCSAARVALGITAANQQQFECGKPYGPCGSSVPEGVLCEAGLGWCQPGYHCAAASNGTDPSSVCLPVPANCGLAGNACCPSNTDAPHNASMQKVDRKPFCRDNSTCFYDTMEVYLTGDIHAGIPGLLGCLAVPLDCGTMPGSTCCPDIYHYGTNPLLPRSGCPTGDMYCDNNATVPPYPGSSLLQQPPGACRDNAADCGRLGKPCCISSGASIGVRCAPEGGARGFCADDTGRTLLQGANAVELKCTACPSSDMLGEQQRSLNPEMYFRCKPS